MGNAFEDPNESVGERIQSHIGVLVLVQLGFGHGAKRRKGILLPGPDGAAVEVFIRLKDYTSPVRPLAGLWRKMRMGRGEERSSGFVGIGLDTCISKQNPVQGRWTCIARRAGVDDESDDLA